jgi:serine O-acetyltransferase
MRFPDLVTVISADLYRLDAKRGFGHFVRALLSNPCSRYTALFRLCQHARARRGPWIAFYPFLLFLFGRTGSRYGIRIPLSCEVGTGLYIGHWGGIWISPESSIGKNCTLMHEVPLGRASRGPTEGSPTVGNHVYIGPGAKIVGRVHLHDHSLVAANSLVLEDLAENCVALGNPSRVVSREGSRGYITNCIEASPDI